MNKNCSERECRTVKLVLDGEKPWSWNKLYSNSVHWSERSKEKVRVHLVVRSVIDPEEPMFDGRVHITVSAFFDDGRRFLDPDNVSPKMYIDGLCGWLIKDDTAEYVASVTTKSAMDRENPRVEILLEEEK